jgi:hypothetical protein
MKKMKMNDFKRKMKAVYPEKEIKFNGNEMTNQATIDDFIFQNMVYGDSVNVFFKNVSCGRSYSVENA